MKKLIVLLIVVAGSPALADLSSTPLTGTAATGSHAEAAEQTAVSYGAMASLLPHRLYTEFSYTEQFSHTLQSRVAHGMQVREGVDDRDGWNGLGSQVADATRNGAPDTWRPMRLRDDTAINQGFGGADSAAAGATGTVPHCRLLPVPGASLMSVIGLALVIHARRRFGM